MNELQEGVSVLGRVVVRGPVVEGQEHDEMVAFLLRLLGHANDEFSNVDAAVELSVFDQSHRET